MKLSSIARRAAARLSYANVVATLALFIALGGVSYAAVHLPKNSVSSRAIKKNAVTNSKIKSRAVTSSKIKNKTITSNDVKSDTLTGDQINESTLAVPFAAAAGTANDTFQLRKVASPSATNSNYATALAAATEIPLVSYGQVSIYGKCFVVTGSPDRLYFEMFAKTTANGAALFGHSVEDDSVEDALDTSTLEVDRQVGEDEWAEGINTAEESSAGPGALIGPDGRGINFALADFAVFGAPTNQTVIGGTGSRCVFSGTGSYSN